MTDIERAAAFYATVLGLKMKHVEAPPDVVMEWFESENPNGGGCLIQMEGRTPSEDGTYVYFSAEPDIQAVLDRVEPAGGKVVMGKNGSDDGGYVAFFTDSEGNRVGLASNH